jgi:hypothetical protein
MHGVRHGLVTWQHSNYTLTHTLSSSTAYCYRAPCITRRPTICCCRWSTQRDLLRSCLLLLLLGCSLLRLPLCQPSLHRLQASRYSRKVSAACTRMRGLWCTGDGAAWHRHQVRAGVTCVGHMLHHAQHRAGTGAAHARCCRMVISDGTPLSCAHHRIASLAAVVQPAGQQQPRTPQHAGTDLRGAEICVACWWHVECMVACGVPCCTWGTA